MTNEMVCVVLIYSTIRVFYWCEDAIWSFPSWCNCRMKRIRTISEKVGILNLTSSMTYELILIGRVTNLTFGYKKSIEINKFFVFFQTNKSTCVALISIYKTISNWVNQTLGKQMNFFGEVSSQRSNLEFETWNSRQTWKFFYSFTLLCIYFMTENKSG